MKLPVSQQLSRQDFPEAPQWISKLLYPLQLFMTNVLNALRQQLTLQDNMSAVIQQFTITAGPLATDNIYTFPFTLGRQPVQLTASATNGDGTYTPIYLQVSWNYINQQIVINGMTGLTSTKKYNITVVVQ